MKNFLALLLALIIVSCTSLERGDSVANRARIYASGTAYELVEEGIFSEDDLAEFSSHLRFLADHDGPVIAGWLFAEMQEKGYSQVRIQLGLALLEDFLGIHDGFVVIGSDRVLSPRGRELLLAVAEGSERALLLSSSAAQTARQQLQLEVETGGST